MFPVYNSFDRDAFLSSFKPLRPIPLEGEDHESVTVRYRLAQLEDSLKRQERIRAVAMQARFASSEGNYTDALAFWMEASRKNGGENLYYFQKIAETLFQLRRYEESRQRYEQLLQAFPDNDRYLEASADCYYFLGEVAKAKALYTRVQEIRQANCEICDSVKEKLNLLLKSQCSTSMSLIEILQKINFSSTAKLKEEEASSIAALERTFSQEEVVEWNKFIHSTRDRFLKEDPKKVEKIILSTYSGRRFSVPICKDFEGIVHFAAPTKAKNILYHETRAASQLEPFQSSFWTKHGAISALCTTSDMSMDFRCALPEVGFLLDIPDPQRNIMTIICYGGRNYFFEDSGILSPLEAEFGNEMSDCFLRMGVIAPLIAKAYTLSKKYLAKRELHYALLRLSFLYGIPQRKASFFSSLKGRICRVFERCFSCSQHVEEFLEKMLEIEQKEDMQKDETYAKFLNIFADCKDCVKKNSSNRLILMGQFEERELYEKIEKSLVTIGEKGSKDALFQESIIHSSSFFSLLDTVQKLKISAQRLLELGENEGTIHINLFNFLGRSDKKIVDILDSIQRDILNICHAHLSSFPKFLHISEHSVASFLEILPKQFVALQKQYISHKVIVRPPASSFRIGGAAVSIAGVVLEGSKLQHNRISNELGDILYLAQCAKLPCFVI
jgi:hypothetical protein